METQTELNRVKTRAIDYINAYMEEHEGNEEKLAR